MIIFTVLGCDEISNPVDARKEQAIPIEIYLQRLNWTTESLGLKGRVKSLIEYEVISETILQEYPEIKYLEGDLLIKRDSIDEGQYYIITSDNQVKGIKLLDISIVYSFKFSDAGDLLSKTWYNRMNDRDRAQYEENQYDRFGHLIGHERFDYFGNLDKEVALTYDKSGKVIRLNRRNENYSGEENFKISYRSDTTFIERIDSVPKPYFDSLEMYDSKGNQLLVDPKGRFKVTAKGDYEKLEEYYFHGDVYSSTIYEYDTSGNEIARTDYDSEGNIIVVGRKYYDDSGKLIAMDELDGESFRVKRIKKYDYSENFTSFSRTKSFGYSLMDDYRENYNRFGDVIQEVRVWQDSTGKLIESRKRIDYEYDKQGNWLVQSSFEKDSLTRKVKRVIIYH